LKSGQLLAKILKLYELLPATIVFIFSFFDLINTSSMNQDNTFRFRMRKGRNLLKNRLQRGVGVLFLECTFVGKVKN
jgi:hypothetical protein